MITGIHHINFLVYDLDTAVSRYSALLGGTPFEYADLVDRGVRTAKADVGGTWLVLVQPTDPKGAPAQHIAQHGEGFFLMSFQTDDLAQQIERCSAAQIQSASAMRKGLDNWRVVDLSPTDFFGAQIQLTEELPTTIRPH